MPNANKNKGSAYERAVAKFLTDTYHDSFIRTPNSGAYIGGTNQHRTSYLSTNQIQSFKGDITPPNDWKYFNAECKAYADFPFHTLVQGKSIPLLDKWIQQTLEVASSYDVNIIFLKVNRKGEYVIFQNHVGFINMGVPYKYHRREWLVTSQENFFKMNTNRLKNLSVNGTTVF